MKIHLLFLAILTWLIPLLSTASADGYARPGGDSRMFYPTGRDRAAIQAALDAAEEVGGVVQLGYGDYDIQVVNSPASGDKAAGAYGLEIPSGVTLQGMGDSTVLRIIADGDYGVGCGISPKGMRTATTNFGAASKVRLADFTIGASTQAESSGNLINLVHASDWVIERVNITGSLFHGIEIDQSRRITVVDCKFSGSYSGGSGSWIQFDNNVAGPVNRPATITTNSVEDITFVRCYGAARPGTDTAARDIDINHAANLTVGARFIDCIFEGRASAGSTIVGIDTNAAVVDTLTFDRCKFVTSHYAGEAFYFANTSAVVRRLAFTACDFSGPSAVFLRAAGNTSLTYNATHTQRHSVTVEGCSFKFDKTQMQTGTDVRQVILVGWTNAVVKNNYFRGIGDFPVSVGNAYSYLSVASNCLGTTWSDNLMMWEGNNTFAVNRVGQAVLTTEADNAGLTMGVTMTNNRVYSTAGTGFNYGVLAGCGTTVPARRGFVFEGNFSNAATAADGNAVVSGTTTGGSPTSGGMGVASRNVTANTTLTPQDFILNCDTTSGSITVTAPNVLHRQMFRLRKTSASNNLTLGSTTVTANNATITGWSDGSTFYTVAD